MDIAFSRIIEIDRKINSYFESLNNLWLKMTFGFLTHLGSGAVWITIYAFFLFFFKDYFSRMIFSLILAEITGLVIIIILRYITKRERPLPHPNPHFLSPWNKYSFPSHHSMRSFMIASIVGLSYQFWLPFLLFIAVIISFSRIYLLRHYLSDVLTGALLGIFLGVPFKIFLYIFVARFVP